MVKLIISWAVGRRDAATGHAFMRDVMKMIAAELYFLASMQGARELLGKSYFVLSAVEKTAVDQAVLGGIGGNYRQITPAILKAQTAQGSVGFQAPAGPAPPSA